MNTRKILGLTALFITLLSFAGCKNRNHVRKNGWYYVINNQDRMLSNKPFMTLGDLSEVSIERDGTGNLVVLVKLKQEGIKKMENATEASKGKHIAFYCNDSIISMPFVNERISSQFMQIINSDSTLLKDVYETLKRAVN